MPEHDFSEIAKLSERFSKDPKSRIFVQLADAYRKNNMVDEALQVLQQGLQYHPDYPLAHLILGKCYFDKRMFGQAKDAVEKTLSFDAQNIVALRMLAQVCESLKDEDGQLKAYQGISAIDPFDALAQEKLKALEARQHKGPVFTLTLAEEYERQGNLAEALKVYEQLQFTDPTDLVIKQRIGELKLKIAGQTPPVETAGKTVEPAGLKLESMAEIMQDFEKPSPVIIPEPLTIEAPPAPEIAAPEPVTPKIEPVKVEDAVKETLGDASTQPAAVATDQPASGDPAAAKTPAVEEPQEVLTIDEFLVEPVADSAAGEKAAPETIPEPAPAPDPGPVKNIDDLLATGPTAGQARGATPAPDSEPVKNIDDLLATGPTAGQAGGAAPAPAETGKPAEPGESGVPPSAPAPEKAEPAKEEPQKVKEEDFRSFQDWLSGLLK